MPAEWMKVFYLEIKNSGIAFDQVVFLRILLKKCLSYILIILIE